MSSSSAAKEEAMDTGSPSDSARGARDALLDEFGRWERARAGAAADASDGKGIALREAVQDPEDGKTSLEFKLASQQGFTLHCPLHYPAYRADDENFFVEAEYGLHAWCNALNEYLLDTDGVLTLTDILNKGLSLYSSADQALAPGSSGAAGSSGSGAASASGGASTSGYRSSGRQDNGAGLSDDEDDEDEEQDDVEMYEEDDDEDVNQGEDDDEQLEDILDNDLTWELEIARRKKRWKAKEDELRAEKTRLAEAGGGSGGGTHHAAAGSAGGAASGSGGKEDQTLQQLYHDPSTKSRQPKQVFTSAAASGILTNDLVQIMESATATGIEADTVEDNIFQWNVKIKNFTSNCVLDKDFQELKSKFGYDYIELQLDFSMDLYPFFPPLVKVIRPRLQGSMMLRVTTMEILKLSYWNPARDMRSVLKDIKDFLRMWARLDLASERNDRARYPDGAYIDIEHHLLRLALVSEIVPRANKKYVVATPPARASLPASAMEPTSSSSSSNTSTAERKKITMASAAVMQKAAQKMAAAASAHQPSATVQASMDAAAATIASAAAAASASGSVKEGAVPKKVTKSKFAIFGLAGKDSKEKEEKRQQKAAQKNMAKGTGYSSYQQKGWDVKAYMAAQKEKDKQIELVLGKIHQELRKLHGAHQAGARNLPDLVDGANSSGSNNSSSKSATTNSAASEEEDNPRSPSGAASRGGSRRKRKHSPDEIAAAAAAAAAGAAGGSQDEDGAAGGGGQPIDPQSDLYAVLEGSALVPFLESKLQANSFLEICSHKNVYQCVINIVREIACQPYLVSLLAPLPDQATSLHSLLLALETQARVLLDKIGKASANGSVPKSLASGAAGSASSSASASGAGGAAGAITGKVDKLSEKASDDKLARDFLSLSKEVTQALKNTGFLPDINGESAASNAGASAASASQTSADVHMSSLSPEDASADCGGNSATPGGNVTPPSGPHPGGVDAPPGAQGPASEPPKRKSREDKSAELYRKHMRTLQFDSSEFSTTGSQAHAFASNFLKASTPSASVIIRAAQEVSSLSTSLPLDFSSAIFVRSDDDKATLLRAIITGPEDTPYTGGCYQFDIFFPAKYPHSPPQVSFRTTGGGLVRFNPNLYNCGKVCLSLLGTWEGAQGEQWNETSTILQVLISIQSLILCPEPYYNEPGFERLYGTPQGDQESLKYSEDVFRNNLKYAILGQLQNPPEGFEDVVKAHFFLKRHILLKELEKMLEKYKSKEVKKQFQDVKRELMKLEQPPNLKKSFQSAE